MALLLNAVRLFIADDVGIGKTIEAEMIVKEHSIEVMQRGSAFCVRPICASGGKPSLPRNFTCAKVIRPSTIVKLERNVPLGSSSVYCYYPYAIVSIDFAKSDCRQMSLEHKGNNEPLREPGRYRMISGR